MPVLIYVKRTSMAGENKKILNHLLQTWPFGVVAVSPWLKAQGAYQQLMHEYEKSGWVRKIGRGAYARAGDRVDWRGGLYALQQQMRLPVHVADKSALQLTGYAHFLPLGNDGMLSLFGPPGVRLSSWFLKHDWGLRLRYTTSDLFKNMSEAGLTTKQYETFSITLSAPERAMMELLHLVPHDEPYEEAALLMEGLATLRPNLVQGLLESCRSIKVKRLFLHLAEECNHDWVDMLNTAKINLGQGKRMIVKGGRLDTRYNITVPG